MHVKSFIGKSESHNSVSPFRPLSSWWSSAARIIIDFREASLLQIHEKEIQRVFLAKKKALKCTFVDHALVHFMKNISVHYFSIQHILLPKDVCLFRCIVSCIVFFASLAGDVSQITLMLTDLGFITSRRRECFAWECSKVSRGSSF